MLNIIIKIIIKLDNKENLKIENFLIKKLNLLMIKKEIIEKNKMGMI